MLICLLPVLCWAQKDDTLHLYNGDRIIGEIKSMALGKLRLSTDKMGTINVQWDAIQRLLSNKTFEVRSSRGQLYYGRLEPSSAQDQMHIVTNTGAFDLAKERIVELTRIRNAFWDRVDGSVSIGANFTKADDLLSLNAAFNTKYRSRKYRSELNANSMVTLQNGETSNRKQDARLSLDRGIGSRSMVGTQIAAEQNSELGLDLRASAQLYAGYEVLHTNQSLLLPSVGALVNREYTQDGQETNNLEGLLKLRFQKFSYDDPELNIDTHVAYYPSFTVAGRHRLSFELDLRFEVLNDLFLSLTLYDQYDSKPTDSEAANNDYGASISVGYSW